jgi:diguanylate cyclase (GGDEF)-like protein/PAS domain S-box-containing protein
MRLQSLRVLVADDEQTARLLMGATLEKAGYEVVLAADGAEALQRFFEQPCDLVMLDVEMPGLDGFETCVRLRHKAGKELPIVMVTGMDDVVSVERAFQVGATDFIRKPINWALIAHRVRYLVRAFENLQTLHQAQSVARLGSWYLDGQSKGLQGSPEAYRIVGVPEGTPLSFDAFLGLVHPDDGEAMGQAMREALKGEPFCVEHRIVVDGATRWILSQAELSFDADGRFVAGVGTVQDITERKEAENRVYRLAYFDSLTGLPNRQAFTERLQREIQRAAHRRDKLAVLFLDLDRFKTVNDTLGHRTGDLLLQVVADRLRQTVRPADLVARADSPDDEIDLARLGGDEFTLLLPRLRHGENALLVVQRILDLMHRPFILDGREMVVTASIGIAIYPDDGADAPSLLKHADTAMYHAKDLGRDNAQFYSTALTEEAMRRLDMESNLRMGLEREEFFLHYQPQFDLASGRVLSLEALIRWKHPQHGLVPPLEFIPLAEENGLIVPIGAWVLRTACRDAMRWLVAGQPLRIAVNLSAVQFRNPDLVGEIAAILRASGLPAQYLELEVTEGALMEDSASTVQTLNALRGMGLQLSLDDFGTGYSSLSYLQRLPFNNLKVDQSFVRGLPADRDGLAITRAIIGLAKNLGFTVTAEGIETHEQAMRLRGMACEMLQGFYFSRPVAAAEIDALLTRDWRGL